MTTISSPDAPDTGIGPGGLQLDTDDRGAAAWRRLLAWTAGVVVIVDLIFMGLITTVIPPLAVGAVLTLLGLVLLRRVPRTAAIVLGATSLLLVVMGGPFMAEHLAHPSSGIDFAHSAIAIVGRIVAIVASIKALRRGSVAGARRTGTISVVLGGLVMLVATVATISTTGDQPRPDDVVAVIDDHAFPEVTVVAAGGTLFVDNQEPFRHTYTVEGTDIDVVTPASQGVRITIDLEPGTYDVICDIPGHEAMYSTLEVR